MKKLIAIFFLIVLTFDFFGQDNKSIIIRKELSTGIKVCLNDRTTKNPISNQKVKILVNDSLRFPFTTDSLGCVDYLSIGSGIYKVSVSVEGFQEKTISGIKVGSGLSYLTISLNNFNNLKARPAKKKR